LPLSVSAIERDASNHSLIVVELPQEMVAALNSNKAVTYEPRWTGKECLKIGKADQVSQVA
jgi:hypothetical protein